VQVRKLVLSVASLGVLAALVLPIALGAGGGQTIAGAPTLPIGVRVGHSYTLTGCEWYAEIWRIKLARGDRLRVSYGSKNGQPVQILVLDPSSTDQSGYESGSGVLAESSTIYRDDLALDATKAGRYSIVLHTNFPCQKSIWYYLTARVQHAAR
jgi:hypothetical protein